MAHYSNHLYTPVISTPKDLCNEELTEFIGHKDEVNCVSYSSDFQFMVTGSDDQRVRVFKVKTKQCLIKLKGHEGAIRSVAVSPCDKYFASGSYDKTAKVWRTANGECVHTLIGHTKSVEEVAFSPGSIYLCTASWDRTAILWNLEFGCMVKRFEGHQHAVQAVAFSYSFLLVATGSWDFTVRVWRMNQTEYKQALLEYLGTNENDGCDESVDEDNRENKDMEENEDVWFEKRKKMRHSDDILIGKHDNDADACKDSGVDGEDKTKIDDDDNDAYVNGEVDSNENDDKKADGDAKTNDDDVDDSRDGRNTSSCKDIDMYDENGCLVLEGHVGNVHSVAFSRFGMLASGSWDRTIRLWNPNTGWCLRLLLGHEGWVKAITFSPDSTYVASAADDDSVKVWDIPSGKCVKSFEASTDLAQHCAFTQDGVLVASGAAVIQQKAPLKNDRKEEEEEVESLLKSKPLRGILKSASSSVRGNQQSRMS